MKFYTLTALVLFLAGGLTAQEETISSIIEIDNPPEVYYPIPNIEAAINEEDIKINLSDHFSDPDELDANISYNITRLSDNTIVKLNLSGEELTVDILDWGQVNVMISASYNGLSCTDTFVIGVRPHFAAGGYDKVTFDDILLEEEAYWNGADLSESFSSGMVTFSNSYNPDWFSWSGWACSNTTDNTTPGFMNQYSAISSVRLDSIDGKNYGLSYASPSSELTLSDGRARHIQGFFVTNSTYAALSMKFGDDYTKKFGGIDGNDPDWLNLQIIGYNSFGDSSGTVNFKLADFTSEDSIEDYIIETWQWVDLTSLGEVCKLNFSMTSTDNGDWGMNTPAFFCMDNLHLSYLTSADDIQVNKILLYPNPSNGVFKVASDKDEEMNVHVYNISGMEVAYLKEYMTGDVINIEDQAPGTYIVKIETAKEIKTERLIIQ